MIHKIWITLFLVGIAYSIVTGTVINVNQAVVAGARDAISLIITLAGVLTFWTGVLQVANKAGVLRGMEKALRPLIRLIYPKLGPGHPAIKYLTTNMVSNLFGLGNVATPTGIKAMKELQATSPDPSKPTFEMYTLLVMNTAGFTLIPTTIIGIRAGYQAANPADVLMPILFASGASVILGLAFHQIYSSLKGVTSSGKGPKLGRRQAIWRK
ncbi:MAG: spore maturation protein [Turicibacter sp.]|nr:spore maturation protein [Turicibacter sp.]